MSARPAAPSASARLATPPTSHPSSPETSLLFDVFALGQAVNGLLGEAMRAAPLSPSEYAVSSAIFELEAASPTELATRLGMRLTTCVDQLRAFERRGLARRIANPTDRRSYRVVLTAEGLAAQRAANRAYQSGARAFERALGEGYDGARAALRNLRAAADAARSAAAAGIPTPPSGGRAG